jgi:hypothetical protein
LRFGLPGTPVFPDLTAETILKPRLEWLIATDKPGKFPAEFSYITGGMSWQADYNIVAPEKGDVVDIVGWVTIDNRTGKAFENAHIKLMAGDVNKIQPNAMNGVLARKAAMEMSAPMAPTVTEKAFDEYHLYTLERATTLRDRETKQVEFIHASAWPASSCMFTMAQRLTSTVTADGTGKTYATIIPTAPNRIRKSG